MTHPQLDEISSYWAKHHGCVPEDFTTPGIQFVFAEEADANRIVVLQRAETTVICTSTLHADELRKWRADWNGEQPPTSEDIASAFSNREWQSSASETISYLPPDQISSLKPSNNSDCEIRRLFPDDSTLLTKLQAGCSAGEQRMSNISIDHFAIFGVIVQGRLVAAASLIDEGENIADIGILVHPEHRRQGFGRLVVAALCRWGVAQDWILQYCWLDTNVGSGRLAESLGFLPFGTHWRLFSKISAFR